MNWDLLEIGLREWKKDQHGSRQLRRWRRSVRQGARSRMELAQIESARAWARAARNG